MRTGGPLLVMEAKGLRLSQPGAVKAARRQVHLCIMYLMYVRYRVYINKVDLFL